MGFASGAFAYHEAKGLEKVLRAALDTLHPEVIKYAKTSIYPLYILACDEAYISPDNFIKNEYEPFSG